MDVTSIKQPAVDAMLESESQVVGLHPMFRPEVSFDGQTIVVCPARTALPHWKTWVVNVLAKTGSTLKWSTPSEHDKYMIVVQVNPHLGNLVSALLIAEDGISVTESLEFTSPFYRIMFSLMGRLIGQNAGLYADIVMENLETVAMLERRIKIEQRMIEMIRAKDYDSFEKLFVQAREHFGPKVIKNANELFTRLIGVLNTLYGRNSIILEVAKKYDGPSLLQEILGVFSGRKINLAGINSVILGEKLQFTISLDQSRSSDGVRRALEELEKWEDPKVEIIN
jgi:prephenate dehydrogenase